ncbi:MAG: carboxypeptidase regulatory-like domain-containing protein [Candidatus Latescibacteria bacterium]|nr:carboxypeptidase regulatory-like domain-containing protein [Candidatus Latescibacterota bacterium]
MPTRYRSPYLVLLLLLGSVLGPALAAAGTPGPRLLERAQILRTLDLIRHGSGRIPLPAAGVRAKAAQPSGGTGTITGMLAGLDPDGFASASVTAWSADATADSSADSPPSRDGIGMAMVEPDGRYRIEGLAPGAYYVSASAKGYLPQYFKGARTLSDAVPVKVAEGETTEGIDFPMEPLSAGAGSLAGTVRFEDGHPISGATVYVFSPDNPFYSSMAQTGEDGTYLVSGLIAGAYVVQVWASSALPEFYDNAPSLELATRVEVGETARTDHIDFSLATGGSISGYVRNAAGEPLAGAYVQAYMYEIMPAVVDSANQQGEGVAVPVPSPDGTVSVSMPVDPIVEKRGGYLAPSGGWAVSDEQGFYRIGGLSTGSYYVMAQASSRWYYTTQWYDGALDLMQAKPVAVTLDVETAGIDLALAVPAMKSALTGRVTDRQGQPVVEAFVTVQDAAQWGFNTGESAPGSAGTEGMVRSNIWAYAVTDKEGNYAVEELPAGTYLVSAAAQSGWEYVQRWYRDATSPQDAAPVPLGAEERLAGIDVVLPVQVGTASIAGVVRDSQGQPLPWAYIEVRPATAVLDPTQPSNLWAYAQADSQGAYRVDRLPAGAYAVHAAYGTGELYGQGWYQGVSIPESLTPVALAEGEARSDIDFNLTVRPIYGVVEGTISDVSTGAPRARAYVELSPVARDYIMDAPFRQFAAYAVTDEAGHFQLTYVPEGQYTLVVYADGAAANSAEAATPIGVVGGEVATQDVALSQLQNGEGVITGSVTVDYGGPIPMSSRAPAWDSTAPPALEAVDLAKGEEASGTAPEIAVVVAYPLVDGQVKTAAPYTAVSAIDGSYTLRGLAPGDYVVMSFAPGCIGAYYDATYAPELATPVHVDGQQPAAGINFVLAPAYFWRLAAADGAAPEAAPSSPGGNAGAAGVYGKVNAGDGKAVQGATVYLLDAAAQPVAYGQTGVDGSFELSGVAPGEYRVYASKVGLGGAYNGNVANFAQADALVLNGGAAEINLVLSPGQITAVEEEETVLPQALALRGNYPNPFNPSTQLGFAVPKAGHAIVRVYNALGQQVAVLFDGMAEASRQYDLSFQAGALSAGTYVYTLEFGGQVLSRKMALVK